MKIQALNKRRLFFSLLLSLIITPLQIAGWQLSFTYNTSVHQSEFFQNICVLSTWQAIALYIVEVPLWCALFYFLFGALEKITQPTKEYSPKQRYLLWGLSAVLLFLCWLPCLLAAFPGFYNYDAFDQVPQALYKEVPYSSHHPLLHTLFMGKIIAFGYHLGGSVTLNDGVFLYSIVQMLLCAVAFGYFIAYILKISRRRYLALAAFCYYAFFPTIAMFAMSTTKDVLFSVLLQYFILLLYEMFRDLSGTCSSMPKLIRFAAIAVLMCLFRKNGIYIIVGLLPFVLYYGRKFWKKILPVWCSIIFAYLSINSGLEFALNAEKGSSIELFSVPIQQLARVYNEHGESAFDEDQLALIYESISAEALMGYNPFLSDNIKNRLTYQTVLERKGDFFVLWFDKLTSYPKEYIRAFLDNTYQAWYPGTSIYDEPGAEKTYYFGMDMWAGAERDSKAPKLLEFYEKIATGYSYQKLLVVRLFFSIGFMFWAALFILFYGIYRKNHALTLAMLGALLCCATVFLGPVSLVRYYLVLFYGFPVSVGFLFHRES